MPNRVADIRKSLGLTREHLAYHSGLSLRTIERIEAGRNQPRLENAIKIAGVLRCRLDEAFPEVAA